MPYRVDARLSGRHPFETYTLYLAILTSVPSLLSITPRPGSISDVLPDPVAFAWNAFLLLGAVLALAGIYWRERATGLVMEQLGLGLVGVTSLIYVACVLFILGLSGALACAIVGGFGISCLRRYWQIQAIVDSVAEVEKRSHE